MKEALIDTDIFSYYMKGNQKVSQKIIDYLTIFPALNLSYITYYEILKGLNYKNASRQINDFKVLVGYFNLINIDIKSVQISSKIYGNLRQRGIVIGTADILIVGIAITNNLELITNNTKHFKHIENLMLDNWKI